MEASFFIKNRQALVDSVKGGLVVLSAYSRMQRSNDMAFYFEQEANFWYLTGIEEPDWRVIIDGSQQKAWLIMPDIEDVHRTFDGGMAAYEASAVSGIGSVLTADEGAKLLRSLSKTHSVVHTVGQSPHAEHYNFYENPNILRNYHALERTFSHVGDCRKELATLRAIKQPSEISVMQKAIDITITMFNQVHMQMDQYKNEAEIAADFSYGFNKQHATHAYDPIIAAGSNACTLHYVRNSMPLHRRQLVLMDVGARVGGYSADISRTFVKGEPTKRQRLVHEVVKSAHLQIIQLIAPYKMVAEYQREVDNIIIDALRQLGLYKNETSLRKYFPHAISHGLGIDVHDSLGAPKHFEEGMVLTVEPGVYIPEEKIGVRIEDDILITKSGRKNMSRGLSTGL